MEHIPEDSLNVSELAILRPLEDTDAILEAGYSIVAPIGAAKRIEPGSWARSTGYPFKRYLVACRPNGIDADLANGLHKEANGVDKNRDGVRLLLKGRAFTARGSKTDKMENGGAKSRSWIYTILISVVICCFLAEAVLQGSVLMLLKRSDFSPERGDEKSLPEGDTGALETYPVEYTLRFVPWKFKERFIKQQGKSSVGELRKLRQSSLRQPRLALVCSNLERSPQSLYLITLWQAIQVLGYKLELFTLEDGPMRASWVKASATVSALHLDSTHGLNVDWSNFEGVILSSLNAKLAVPSLMQEPFKGVPVVWIILEDTLGQRLRTYESTGLRHLINEWKQAFERADVLLFPDYALPMEYSLLDSGNFFVIPGSPVDVWEPKQYMATHRREDVRKYLSLRPRDIAIVVVGSPFSYKGVWREHAIIMRAILPIARDFNKIGKENTFSLRLFFVSGNSSSGYRVALEVMAAQLGLANDTVSHFGSEKDLNGLLWAADVVVYSSLREEQTFPNVLIRAMVFERLILAPNSSIIQNYIENGIQGLLFPAGNIKVLTHTFSRIISEHGLTNLAQTVASGYRLHANGLLVADAVAGFAELLETVLQFPSETQLPLSVPNIPEDMKRDWQWQLLNDLDGAWNWETSHRDVALDASSLVYELERQLNRSGTRNEPVANVRRDDSEWLSLSEWEDVKLSQLADDKERWEEEQLDERRELSRGTWEDIYRSVKKAERVKDELHERDDGELERTGQPLCIYEPYFGTGAWSFLHEKSALYRGISLSLRQRRPGFDDVEAASRLPLLNDSYYQNALCEFGSFFAMANRIDRIHKNAWIGFQTWRAAGRKVALLSRAEEMLGNAVSTGSDGDALYFWAQTDGNSTNGNLGNRLSHQDFWSYCDAVNNGNCRSVFLETFKQMYGLPSSWTLLPPMPLDGDSWAVLHCWAMPTSSFLEFVMFARMFVSALDSQLYSEHHDLGKCCLGTSKSEVQRCYCRLLELLVNVWAYHSGRRMIYVDPSTGSMLEQHNLNSRRGHMWMRFFSHGTLKGMDEDLAEEVDDGPLNKRWLWPQTGEIFCQRIYERERRERYALKLEKKKRNKERLERIRSRYRQRPLAGG